MLEQFSLYHSFLHLKLLKLLFAKRRVEDDQIPIFFLCIPASTAAAAAAVNPKGIKTLLVNGLITLFINGNPVFSSGANNLPKNPPD